MYVCVCVCGCACLATCLIVFVVCCLSCLCVKSSRNSKQFSNILFRFQELDTTKSAHVFTESEREREWALLVERALHSKANYRRVGIQNNTTHICNYNYVIFFFKFWARNEGKVRKNTSLCAKLKNHMKTKI